jgi:hypothetical protein
MSRPQKMHKPLKFNFTEIINAVADGKGVKLKGGKSTRSKGAIKATRATPPKQK